MITQTITPDPMHSVEISQTAKGLPQVCIRIHREDPEEAAREALSLYRRLTAALEQGQATLAPAWQDPTCPEPELADDAAPF